jgi:hypothetical protein
VVELRNRQQTVVEFRIHLTVQASQAWEFLQAGPSQALLYILQSGQKKLKSAAQLILLMLSLRSLLETPPFTKAKNNY